jgi:hypothetical protein
MFRRVRYRKNPSSQKASKSKIELYPTPQIANPHTCHANTLEVLQWWDFASVGVFRPRDQYQIIVGAY